MNLRLLLPILAILFSVIVATGCSSSEDFIVLHQVTGGIETNCYLLYGSKSKEAALIDVAGPVDSLVDIIHAEALDLKYFLFTHGHFDHVVGLPEIRDQFPEAKICIHETDYKDMFSQKEWATNNLGQEFIDYLLSDPERKKIYEFNMDSFGTPDIFVRDNQLLRFGSSHLKVIHSPGHSPGSVCFQIKDILFSGDVLFYRTVGRVDVQNSSREDQINSVQKLYEILPDNTKVYPGHGDFTDIGSEKRENSKITPSEIYL